MYNSRVRTGFPCVILLLLLPILVSAQSATPANAGKAQVIAQVPSPLSLEVNPIFDIPLGDSSNNFNFGGGADISLSYQFPGSMFCALGGLEYSFVPDLATDSLSLAAARIGAGIRIPFASWIAVLGYATGGCYFAAFNDLSCWAVNPYVAAGLSLQFSFIPGFRLGAGAQYKYYMGLYQGISATFNTSIALGDLGGSVIVPSLELRPAFPVFFKYYDDHPIGSIVIKSNLKVPATNLRVQVYIKQYMDAPKKVEVGGSLAAGTSRKIDLYALFTDKVLDITEGTKVAAEISISYVIDGQTYEDKSVEAFTLLGRNAMTWDDNRKAAAYVTAKSPQVLAFSREVTSYVHSKENRSVNENLQAAIALHEALDLYGLNYTRNPVTPYDEASKDKTVIDFLQFPAETLKYKAGDCSDISILYAALLQAVGIDTAFVTIPGHIFVAVSTGVAQEKAETALIPQGQFIPYEGKAWIPVEITMRHHGFLKAWELGSKEWNENNPQGQAGFYPLQEAWKSYQPVGLPGAEPEVAVPVSEKVLASYRSEVQRYIDAAILPQVAKLQEQVKSTGSLTSMNSLGVLYAKFGQTDKAEAQFKAIVAKKGYLPAILNLGNLYYTKGDCKRARECYLQASEIDPRNPRVLLNLARANRELANYDEAMQCFDKLKQVDPGLAEQFAFLGQGKDTVARAADVESERRAVLWEGE
jgi:tetratricopeptide (TPR) repeat protein